MVDISTNAAAPRATPAALQPPMVTDTYWGYRIEAVRRVSGDPGLADPAIRLLGLALIVAGYGAWLLPSSLFPGDPFTTKAALSAIFAAIGFGVYWFSDRGRYRVVEVDLSRRHVRIARRTARGAYRHVGLYPMNRIEEAFVERAGDTRRPAELRIRVRNTRGTVLIARGTEWDLRDLHMRLSRDIRPLRDKVDDKLAQMIAFRSSRSAA